MRIETARKDALRGAPGAAQQALLAGFGEKVANQHTARIGLEAALRGGAPPG
jgi:hypothetical protein